MILGLFTQLLTEGGIERVGRHTAVVLTAVAREGGVPCRILSLNDARGMHTVRVNDLSAQVEGFARSKIRFITAAVTAAPRATLAYFGHARLAMVGVLMKAARPKLRMWVHLHGVEVWEPLPAMARRALRMATGLVSISKYSADKAADVQGVSREKMVIVPNALDPEMLERRNGDGSPPRCFPPTGKTLLTVARLSAAERYKGVDTVIRALPQVVRAHADVTYVVIGDGGDRPRLARIAEESNVAASVLFAGHIPEDELIRAYQHCDVFVMPSSGEGFGVVFLEAMTFEKPVVAGNHGGAPEVVEEGVTGYLVGHDDISKTADRIVQLLDDESLSRRMGIAGRKRVEDNFSFSHFRLRLGALLAAPIAESTNVKR